MRSDLCVLTAFAALGAISGADAVSASIGSAQYATQGPGGPIVVITKATKPFTKYYAEILRNEGFNSFVVADISSITPGVLSHYDLAILGEMELNSGQTAMLANWVRGGGNLIAMRPDKKLSPLLGLVDAGGKLANGYLLVDNVPGPGSGIVHQTMQFHDAADLYTTATGTSIVARLFSTATAALPNPAVTLRMAGAGSASAFAYDLARSVVYTRQGNPAWAGQKRDRNISQGKTVIRPPDLFYGASANDPQRDWNNLDNVSVPIADEQQRLLGNLILTMNRNKKPLPRFWYFPSGLRAVVIMTGDDHTRGVSRGFTSAKFEAFKAASFAGCSVSKWECVRSTAYIFTGGVTVAEAQQYSADGFEIALHVNTKCENFTPVSLPGLYSTQLQAFETTYPELPPPATVRTHCVAWSDYATQPQVEFTHGIRLDTNYYYWPREWAQRPGMFTGSGMPMRFAAADGTMIDVYQVTTQITDESQQQEPYMIDSLLDQALGPAGYYGAFTANMHPDTEDSPAGEIVAAAQARGVPVISAVQMLQWLDGRNDSSFKALRWDRQALSFTIDPAPGAVGVDAMLPLLSSSGALSDITWNGRPVSYMTETIKGFEYAFFPALAGNYTARYDAGTPTMLTVSPAHANLQASQVQRFTLLRNGAPLPTPNVTWTISPRIGSVSAAGIYSAPPAIPVTRPVILTATSAPDGAEIAATTIILMKQGKRSLPRLIRLAYRLLSVVSWEIHKILSVGRWRSTRKAFPARNT